jgi:hypothetical protein
MTLDAIDRAFVARWQARGHAAPPSRPPAVAPAAASPPTTAPHPDREPDPGEHSPPRLQGVGDADLGDADLVARLLVAGGRQWAALADEIEAARLAGHRVIGIAGGARAEGRTTLVACLARTLRGRGRDVVVLTTGMAAAGPRGVPADGGRLHDKRIVLVDAGIWFPPGPFRRPRLLMASLGCDAAILVRRADREPAPAWAAALAAVGVTVLGEVLTFATAAPGDAA